MKQSTFFTLLFLVCAVFSCDDTEDGKVTFYVGNAGDVRIWDHVAVEVGGKTLAFFTPESQNMDLTNCDASLNAATFTLSPGSYPYKAGNGKWNGTVDVKSGGCLLVKLNY
jgi:hypothetical protein